ncbi:TfuA-like protein [Streptomyces sp. NBC_00287]|uniref:TfuA-like protein n=1 Tax=Streptomyces sp. NBC_00287 TaxID=2975702 RepID=UPI002E2AD094|nr:TfuA-like protein [Streptomyces sp. NBC_00287]
MNPPAVHVFCGPTLPAGRVRELLSAAVCHPPVGHGDLLRLDTAPGDTVVIIDGVWHQRAPVRHKEILLLLAEGVRVVGAASMGALRAAELAPYGMTGVGCVFEDLADGVLDADDEVAVLHTPEGQPVSEALVNIRAALIRCAATGQISQADAGTLEGLARTLPYTRRTWAALARRAREEGAGAAFAAVDGWRRRNPYDVKRQDAERALVLVAESRAPKSPAGARQWEAEPWRTSFVRYWTAAHRPGGVPFLAVLQHQQLYDARFPARWRARVLSAVAAGQAPGPEGVEAAALRVAAAEGVEVASMSRQQLAYWLVPAELQALPPGEALLRIMVRSARLDGAWSVWPSAWAEAGDLVDGALPTAEDVAAAYAVNAAVEEADHRHTIARLSADRIGRHLVERWNLPACAGRPVLDAAARDRAFRDFAGAIEVARAFYLGAHADTPAASAETGSCADCPAAMARTRT